MPKPSEARPGNLLEINHQAVEFSFWPVAKRASRYSFQARVFTSNPWAVIEEAISHNCPKANRRTAHAFRDQAQDFFEMSQTTKLPYTKPLLLYYSFMNLAKAFVLMSEEEKLDYRPNHGLSEKAGNRQVEGAEIKAHGQMDPYKNAFADLYFSLTGKRFLRLRKLKLGYLLAQVLFGHRLWCSATNKADRFIPIQKLEFVENKDRKEVWLRAAIKREELRRSNTSQRSLLKASRLSKKWKFAVCDNNEFPENKFLWLESVTPRVYKHRAADELLRVAADIKENLWASVLLHPPYRRYYLYLAPDSESASVLPQLLSMYAIIFFLGSVTRYRPHHFENLLDTRYGPHLIGAIDEIPSQFVYLLASEILGREVTKSSIA